MLDEQRPATAPGSAVAGGPRAAWRDPATWVIAAAVFGAYLTLSLYRLFTLSPMSWDLGIYTEYVKQYADGRAPVVDIRGAGFNLLGDHFQPIVGLIAPFFRIFPSPATLLVAQALLIAVSVFPVVSAGFAALRSPGRARAVGLAYGFSWGLQKMADFDFHEIAFAVPLLAFSLSFLVRGRWRASVAWALPLVLVKEDQGFTVAALGILLLCLGWRAASPARVYGGVLLMVWGLAWSLLAITVIIPHVNPQHVYYYWKDGGVAGSGGSFSVGGLAAQPFLGWTEKLQTCALLLLPTAFIALGSPVALLALPSIALRFFSTNSSYWGTAWHYNATVMPILFIAAIEAMGRWDRAGSGTRPAFGSGTRPAFRGGAWRAVVRSTAPLRWTTPLGSTAPLRSTAAVRSTAVVRAVATAYGPAMMVAAACAFAFQFPLANLWQGATYQITPHVKAAEAAMAKVPSGVTVTTTLDLLAPLAARTDTYWIGNPGNPATAYIVFDGANSGYSPTPANVPAFIGQLYPGDGYRVIFAASDVYVFRRA